MPIIVNGITIPFNGDFIFSNNINIDTVVANGVIVWQKQKAYFAYQNGIINTDAGINNPTLCEKSVNEGWYFENPVIQVRFDALGFIADVGCGEDNKGPTTRMCTNWIPTNVLLNLHTELYHHIYNEGQGIGTPSYEIYGMDTTEKSTKIWAGQWGYNDINGVLDLTISGYTYIKIILTFSTGGGSNGLNKRVFFGIRNIYFS